jgi:hypothetical protein
VPSNLHGFEVVRQEYIAEYDAAAVLYRHKKTGAEARSQAPRDLIGLVAPRSDAFVLSCSSCR